MNGHKPDALPAVVVLNITGKLHIIRCIRGCGNTTAHRPSIRYVNDGKSKPEKIKPLDKYSLRRPELTDEQKELIFRISSCIGFTLESIQDLIKLEMWSSLDPRIKGLQKAWGFIDSIFTELDNPEFTKENKKKRWQIHQWTDRFFNRQGGLFKKPTLIFPEKFQLSKNNLRKLAEIKKELTCSVIRLRICREEGMWPGFSRELKRLPDYLRSLADIFKVKIKKETKTKPMFKGGRDGRSNSHLAIQI